MTRLPDRPGTALVVIDVQKGVVADAFEGDAVIANIGALVARARAGGTARRGGAALGRRHAPGQ